MDVFAALADPVRRSLLDEMAAGPARVVDLAAGRPISRPAVSKHLKVLEGAGLVQHRSRGTRNLYALAPEGLVDLQQWLVATWDHVLGAFAEYVEDHGKEQP